MPLRDSRGRFTVAVDLDNRSALASADELIRKMNAEADAVLAWAEKQEQAHARAAAQMQRSYNEAFASITTGILKVGADAARIGSAAIDAAADRQAEVAQKFSGTRGSLRQLATIEGRPLDAGFIREFAERNVRTGMTPGESIAFQEAFRGSGQQYVGKNMESALVQQYLEKSAIVSNARGLPGKVAGDLAGRILGNRDYTALGAAGPSEALALQTRINAILDAGVGDPAESLKQYNMTSAALLDTEQFAKGTFRSEEDVATAVSMSSQKSVGRAFTGIRAAARGLRDFDNPLVQAAKITPDDDFPTAIAKIRPILEARAAQTGRSLGDVLKPSDDYEGGFNDQATREGIEIQVREGILKGGYAQRAGVAGKIGGPAEAEANLAAIRESVDFKEKQQAAEGERIDAERGQKTERLRIEMMRAENELKAEGRIGTTGAYLRSGISKIFSAGMIPDLQQMDIMERVRQNVARDIEGTGVSIRPDWQADLGGLVGTALDQFGVNPGIGGFVPTPEAKRDEINRALEAADRVRRDQWGNAAGPGGDWSATPGALPSGPDPVEYGRDGLN